MKGRNTGLCLYAGHAQELCLRAGNVLCLSEPDSIPSVMTEAFPAVEFAFGAAKPEQFPAETGPEVAFSGRSNAGKSTAINALCNRKRLAFVSKTPGRTQQVNFYRTATGGQLVDLPGYGYAKVAGSIQSTWDALLGDYLVHRATLRGIVVIMDSRHPLTELDTHLLNWLQPTSRPIHVLLTKADKLNRQQANRVLSATRSELATRTGEFSVQLFSGTSRQGVEEARAKVLAWLGMV